jgi:hypothetical protein
MPYPVGGRGCYSSGARHIHLQTMGFLEEKLSDGLEKNASKRAKG